MPRTEPPADDRPPADPSHDARSSDARSSDARSFDARLSEARSSDVLPSDRTAAVESHVSPAGPTPALRMANLAVHGLFFTLLVVLLVRAAADDALGPAGWATAGALAVAYAAGGVLRQVRESRALGTAWLLTVAALWIALTLQHPEFSYLAFPLYFVCLHVLPLRYGLPAVAALTAAVIAAQTTTPGGLTTAKVLGPLAGAAVALLTAYGYAALYRESRARQRLIDDLVRTRDELAATQREAGRLAERQRLAREIHDTLAQGLSGIVLLAREAGAALPAHQAGTGPSGGEAGATPSGAVSSGALSSGAVSSGREGGSGPGEGAATAGRLLREIEDTASANLAEARRFVHALTPPALEGTSLADALRRLAETADAAFHLDGDPYPLPVEAEVALLRLTQEALANAVRHAAAPHIAVTLAYLDDTVTLDIYDDGKGFDPATAPTPDSFGLHGMHERIAALGGTLVVESAPGEGTAVAATLPLRAIDPPARPAAPDGPAAERPAGPALRRAGRFTVAGVRR